VSEQDFEVFISAIILDRNSQVWFHELMLPMVGKKISHAL
jgi:hypothetical protein